MYDLTWQIIQSVCIKCPLSSICDTLRRWGRLSEDHLQFIFANNKTKAMRTQAILKLAHNEEEVELTTEIAGDLELSYTQLHSKKKLWKAFKLTGDSISFLKDPRMLRSRLIRTLQGSWKHGVIYGNMGCYSGAVWLRMHFDTSNRTQRKGSKEQKGYNPNNSVFILHFQGSPYVIMSNTRIKETTLLTQALAKVFSARKLSYMQLSSRHVFSLADIILKKNCETQQIRSLEELDAEENLWSRCHQKRKQAEDIFEDFEDENKAEKRRRSKRVNNVFGPGPQPTLETLQFKFCVEGRQGIGLCRTAVEFKGSSVLEGLKELAGNGYLRFPLPRHLTSVLTEQRNSFNVVSSGSRDDIGD